MVATSDFSGLASSACALASAAAIAPIVSLDRCMAVLLGEKIKADRTQISSAWPERRGRTPPSRPPASKL